MASKAELVEKESQRKNPTRCSMNAILWWLVETSAVTAVMLPVVAVLCRLFERRPAVQHALWLVVLLKFATPSIVGWPWQVADLLRSATSLMPSSSDSPSMAVLSAEKSIHTFNVVAEGDTTWVGRGLGNLGSTPGELHVITATLLSVWLVGAFLYALRQYRRVRKQALVIQRGTDAPPELSAVVRDVALQLGLRPFPALIVRGIASPFVWCLGRPKLVWPEDMICDHGAIAPRSIIAHELAHVGRRDHWIARLELAAAAIWWWNPLFWIVRRNLTATADMACDALALGAYPEERCTYAESLLRLSAFSGSGVPALGLGVNIGARSSLERRMSLIVSERVHGKLSIGGIWLTALIALVITPSWSLGKADDVTQVPSREALQSESRRIRDLPDVNSTAEIQTDLTAAREAMQQKARARLSEADQVLERAKATVLLASKRVEAIKNAEENDSDKQELDAASLILELAETELEYAEAFRDLADRQINVTK
jgi:beta-lactamase regulating signal transducer with metallopeptidase domain